MVEVFTEEVLSGTLERLGCPVRYWVCGSEGKPWVVFTHGIVMDHQIFEQQAALLSKDYRVLVWDVRGHGQSRPMGDDFSIKVATDDLVAILDVIGADEVILVGHSMGGFISQEFYFQHPHRVRAMVMLGSICITWKQPWPVTFFRLVSPLLFRLCPEPLLRLVIRYSAGMKVMVRAQANLLSQKVPKKDFVKMWWAVTHCDHYERGHRIRVPLLITHGKHDNLVGFGQIPIISKRWAHREKNVHYVVIPNAGHNAHRDHPEFFNRLLLDFLKDNNL